MTSASAPGKIILFGEHAVVYNRPALAVPVMQVHADVEISDSRRAGIWIDAPNISLHAELSALPPTHPLATAIRNTLQAVGVTNPPSLKIRVASTIPVASGLGSGAAVSVAIIRALSSMVNRPLSDDEVNALAYEIEKLHHGTPSGIDNTVITYAKPVYFVRGQPIETFSVAHPFTLVIGDTGVSAPTKKSVGAVRKLWEADKNHWEAVFDKVGRIVLEARKAIESGKPALPAPVPQVQVSEVEGWQELGPLMDANHALLQEMTVSSPELDRLVLAAKTAGAMGAKLSGGGRGGNMIALVNPANAEKVANALLSAGARKTIITTIQ